jgi:membrane-associated phospholipid phosphatase
MLKRDTQPAARKTNSGLGISTMTHGGRPRYNSRMTSRRSGHVGRVFQLFLKTLVFCVTLIIAPIAESDVVTDWKTAALNAIRADKTPPPVASRALAILHASIYDAVNGIVRSHEPYFAKGKAPRSASQEAAASAAAHKVLIALFPDYAESFEELHEATLAGIRHGPHKRRGLEWGESVAEQILVWRDTDKSDDDDVVPPQGSGPGVWKPTPPGFAEYLLPQWGFVTPFAIPSGDFFRPDGPPPLGSANAADYNEVKDLGEASSKNRTDEQTEIALFWADGPGTVTPPGHWNVIAQDVATARRNTLPQNARLFALLNVAMADAAICAWDAKYTYNFWRPVTAIREGDTDGNPATAPEADWISLIVTPPFPDYTSGHSTFSGAAAAVLSLFYRTPRISFTNGSDALPGVVRSFRSFLDAAREAALSRLYGGIHFRSANDDGLKSGLAIGGVDVRAHNAAEVRDIDAYPRKLVRCDITAASDRRRDCYR